MAALHAVPLRIVAHGGGAGPSPKIVRATAISVSSAGYSATVDPGSLAGFCACHEARGKPHSWTLPDWVYSVLLKATVMPALRGNTHEVAFDAATTPASFFNTMPWSTPGGSGSLPGMLKPAHQLLLSQAAFAPRPLSG